MRAPVISVAEMLEWEQATWAAGGSEAQVIARVGELVARRARQMIREGDTVLILAGKGHNVEDTLKAREHMPDSGVYVHRITDPETGIAEIFNIPGGRPALIVEGLFGIGLSRPLDEKWAALIQRVNDLQTQVLSVDVPSGLNADTGQPEGAAIRASVTLTLGAPKQGLLLPSAWPYVGRLEVAPDIGLTHCPLAGEMNWVLPGDFEDYPPARPATGHKGDFGKLAIVAGSLGYHGAAVVVGRGGARAQAGLRRVFTEGAGV